MAEPNLHFYASETNDVLVRVAWFTDVHALLLNGTPDALVLAAIDALLSRIPNGNGYSVWNNVKCSYCYTEFPYRFSESLRLRIEDPTVVLIDGCRLDTDDGIFVVEIDVGR